MNQSFDYSLFKNARGLRIDGGTFTGVAGDVNFNNFQDSGDGTLKALMDASSPSAAFNSIQRFPPPKCHPGTRKEILEKITEWVNQGISAEEPTRDRVLWVHGPAGSGKSAIAQTLAEQCEGKSLAAISRPEPRIKDGFEQADMSAISAKHLNVYGDREESRKDVGIFLEAEFERIRNSPEHKVLMPIPSTSWPSKNEIDLVKEKSDGYFIYAAVLIKFIDQKDHSPITALNHILNDTTSNESAFGELDKLYFYILSQIPHYIGPLICTQAPQGINNKPAYSIQDTTVLQLYSTAFHGI
ncbi:hypothetical protein H0H92_001870 [Tricholoma furcatifolium]|nr:hypothetical protein H0H92_001870 [Tricholoma furcatifolium]